MRARVRVRARVGVWVSCGNSSTASTDGCFARKPMMGGAACRIETACVFSSLRWRGGLGLRLGPRLGLGLGLTLALALTLALTLT